LCFFDLIAIEKRGKEKFEKKKKGRRKKECIVFCTWYSMCGEKQVRTGGEVKGRGTLCENRRIDTEIQTKSSFYECDEKLVF